MNKYFMEPIKYILAGILAIWGIIVSYSILLWAIAWIKTLNVLLLPAFMISMVGGLLGFVVWHLCIKGNSKHE